MTAVMQGVRILEVAEHTFVPAASALLADWGAEVIKIEHVERGDAMRGLASTGTVDHRRRRARAARALEPGQAEPRPRPHRPTRASTSSTSSRRPATSSSPTSCRACARSCKIDVDDIRAHNPTIIYVRGTGQGERGPDADKGSYDSLAYWCRAGIAIGVKQPDVRLRARRRRRPAFGDSIGAMTIAGGIMGALFHRERTGEATDRRRVAARHRPVVDGRGAGAVAPASDVPWAPPPAGAPTRQPARRAPTAPRTAASSSLTCLQAGKYWPELCEVDRPARAGRPTSASPTPTSIMAERRRRRPSSCAEAFAERTADEWRERLGRFSGQWAIVQDTLEAAADPQTVANGYVQDCETADGTPFQLAAAPVQYDGEPRRARPGARVQRARRRDPRAPRPRLGRDRRPQGPRRRRLTAERPPDHHRHAPGHTTIGHDDASRTTWPAGGPIGATLARVDHRRRAARRRRRGHVMDARCRGGQDAGVDLRRRSTSPIAPRSRRPPRRSTGPSTRCSPCAGVADGTPGIEKINFLGHRLLSSCCSRATSCPAARPSA